MYISQEQYERLMKFLGWSIETLVWQKEQTGLDLPPSPELQDAINLREELEDKGIQGIGYIMTSDPEAQSFSKTKFDPIFRVKL